MKIVVIGNGIAGNTACAAIRQFEKKSDVVIISEENVPLYSPCLLADYVCREIDKDNILIKKLDDYKRDCVDITLGEKVTEIDSMRHQVLLNSKRISFDKLIFATGSTPQIPPIKNINKRGVFCFKTMADAELIQRHGGTKAVVIGTGPIGIEVSIALRKMGLHVSVIEMLGNILPVLLDEKPAAMVRRSLEERGIEIYTGEKVLSLLGGAEVTGVVTDKRNIDCDTVILVAGMRPNVELARTMGVEIGTFGGIKVNDQMSTNMEGVYACGDCIESKDGFFGNNGLSLLWHNAKMQGEVAGLNCLDIKKAYTGSVNITGINVYGTRVVSMGRNSRSFSDQGMLDILEKQIKNSYYRFIIQNDHIVGVQGIGKTEELGLFLAQITRKTSVSKLQETLRNKSGIIVNPWLQRLGKFLN